VDDGEGTNQARHAERRTERWLSRDAPGNTTGVRRPPPLATRLDFRRRPGREERDLVMRSDNFCTRQLRSPPSASGDPVGAAPGLEKAKLGCRSWAHFNDVTHLIKLETRFP
jgi:hypothetical protein